MPRLFANNVPGHTTRGRQGRHRRPTGRVRTNGIRFYAIANLDKTSLKTGELQIKSSRLLSAAARAALRLLPVTWQRLCRRPETGRSRARRCPRSGPKHLKSTGTSPYLRSDVHADILSRRYPQSQMSAVPRDLAPTRRRGPFSRAAGAFARRGCFRAPGALLRAGLAFARPACSEQPFN